MGSSHGDGMDVPRATPRPPALLVAVLLLLATHDAAAQPRRAPTPAAKKTCGSQGQTCCAVCEVLGPITEGTGEGRWHVNVTTHPVRGRSPGAVKLERGHWQRQPAVLAAHAASVHPCPLGSGSDCGALRRLRPPHPRVMLQHTGPAAAAGAVALTPTGTEPASPCWPDTAHASRPPPSLPPSGSVRSVRV
jgi:hypothetical protein